MIWTLKFLHPHLIFYLTFFFWKIKIFENIASVFPPSKKLNTLFLGHLMREGPLTGETVYISDSPPHYVFFWNTAPISPIMSLLQLIYIIFIKKKLTLPYIFAALIIKAFHYLAINFSFTTFASDGGQICNKMELDDLIFHLCLSLLIVEQLFCKAAPLINLWTGRTNSFGRYHC